jgi:L-tyrosine C(3)-methyltransferase
MTIIGRTQAEEGMSENGVSDKLTPEKLVLLSMGHSAFQLFYAALELGVFRLLYRAGALTRTEIGASLGLQSRPSRCLLLGLTALGLVQKAGERYSNAELLDEYVRRDRDGLLLKLARFQAWIAYPGEMDFVESLRSDCNVGLQRIPGAAADFYQRLHESESMQRVFFEFMAAWSEETIPLVRDRVDFRGSQLVADVGGGDGTNSISLALANPACKFLVLDIPPACELAERRILASRLADQIQVRPFELFEEEFPVGPDCYLFCHLLVIWGAEENIVLLKKAYKALPRGGRVVVFSSMTSDTEDGPLFSALDSAYFLTIPSPGGLVHSWKDYEEWFECAGFQRVRRIKCNYWTPHGIIVGLKD